MTNNEMVKKGEDSSRKQCICGKMTLCQDLFKDVLRRGVAFAASAVSRQHYAGCADSRTTR